MSLILASASPQRKMILRSLGLDFKVIPADIDEHHSGFIRPHAIARSIALRKAETVARLRKDDWVIGCDTIVCLSNGEISLKPKDREGARSILRTYRNSFCDVYSGLALVSKANRHKSSGFERTRIYFKDFSEESLEQYLDTGDWKGRSGAMTIEGKGDWIRRMEGEYWNVVGMPVDLLKKYLKTHRLV